MVWLKRMQKMKFSNITVMTLGNEFIIQIQESYKASKNNLVYWNFNLNEEIGVMNE